MMPLYVAFFNLIFNSGVLPDYRLEGAIRPIYKNKGDSKSPENYSPITILSCFGKLFTSILNARLNKFLDAHNILEKIRLVSACMHQQKLQKPRKRNCSVRLLILAKHLILYGELGYGRNY